MPQARAFPFVGLRPGGTPFEGPVDAEASALWWNPGALSLMRGIEINLTATAEVTRGQLSRRPIASATGVPGSDADIVFPRQTIANDSFSGFGAITWNFNQNITIALGAFAPWVSCSAASICRHPQERGRGSLDLPSSYHLVSESWTHVYITFAGAFRVSRRVHLGVGLSIVDSFADVTFYRDSALDQGSAGVARAGSLCNGKPCGYENPQAAQRIHVEGNSGVFWKTKDTPGIPNPAGLATHVGIVVQPTDRLWLGLSYQHVFPLASSGEYSSSSPRGSQVTPAPGAVTPCSAEGCSGGAKLSYKLPDVWHLGMKISLMPTLELAAWARLVVYGNYGSDDPAARGLVVQLSGAPVRAGIQSRLVFDYGLQPAFAGEVGLRWRAHRSVRLGLSTAAETSAVRPAMISLAAFDAPKFDVMIGVEWQAHKRLRLTAAYGLTAYFPPDVQKGGNDPGATVNCVDARYSLDACGDTLAGRGLPSNSGSYTLLKHHFTLSGIVGL